MVDREQFGAMERQGIEQGGTGIPNLQTLS